MRTYFSWVLGHRRVVVVLIAILTALSFASLSRATVASSVGELFFGDAPEYLRYLELGEKFGSDEVVLIAYEEPDPLSVESLDRLERIRTSIEDLHEIERTVGLLNLDRIHSDGDVMSVEKYADLARGDPESRDALAKEIRADPLLANRVFSRSGTHAMLMIELTVDPNRRGEVGARLAHSVRAAFAAEGYGLDRIREAGMPIVLTEMIRQTFYSFKVIFPLTVLLLISVVVVLFRTPLPVFLSAGVSLLAALWTMGAAALVDPTMNIFYGMVPPVVTIVAISDVIHLWSAYLHELSDGRDKDAAIMASATDVGRACLLTSVTTCIGFLSLALIPTPIFQELGVVLGCGVGIALLLAMTLVPIAASLSAAPSHRAQQMDNPIGRLVDRLVRGCSHLSTRHAGSVIAGFGVFGALILWGVAHADIESNFLHRLDAGNKVRIDAAWFESELTGTQSMEVFVSSDTPGRMLDPDVMAGLAELQERLEATPEVEDAMSIVDLVRRIDSGLGGTGAVPDTRAAIAQYLLLFEMGGGENLTPLIDFDRQQARVTVRLNEHRVRRTWELSNDATAMAGEVLPADLHAETTGIMACVGGWLDEIVTGQLTGVVTSVLSITVLMMIGLRSVGVGLWSMIPNLLPLFSVTAAATWAWGAFDSDTLAILMMAVGIGVDDTIHFLTRYRIEAARTASSAEAIERTFAFAGRAIVMTTVVLAIGFLPFLMSDYYSAWIMGSLLPLALVVAMVADLLLVPALAHVGLMRFRQTGSP